MEKFSHPPRVDRPSSQTAPNPGEDVLFVSGEGADAGAPAAQSPEPAPEWSPDILAVQGSSPEEPPMGTIDPNPAKPEGKKKLKRGEKREPTPEELAGVAEFQQILDGMTPMLQAYAEDRSLSFKVGFRWYIHLDTGVISVDLRSFMNGEQRESRAQIMWSLYHEITHFLDLREDPAGMSAWRDYLRQKARMSDATDLLTKKYQEAWASKPELVESILQQEPFDPNDPSKGTMNKVQGAVFAMLHKYDNVLLDDYWANARIARKYSRYNPPNGQDASEIQRLYSDKLFRGTDYRNIPRHLQFIYKFLRELMVPDKPVLVSDEVQQVLERRVKYLGKDYSVSDIVRMLLPSHGRNTKKYFRSTFAKLTIEPLFMELLMRDLEDFDPGPPPDPQQPQDGDGEGDEGDTQSGGGGIPKINPFQKEYDDYDDKSPDRLPEQGEGSIEKYVNKKIQEDKDADKKKAAEEAKKAAEDAKSVEQKDKERTEAAQKKWRNDHNIPKSVFDEFVKTEAAIEPYLQPFAELWDRITHGSSIHRERAVKGPLVSGSGLLIPRVIANWAEISTGKHNLARIWERTVLTEKLVRKPEKIRIRVVFDTSVSMDDPPGDKRQAMKQVVTLILSSLTHFENLLNLRRSEHGSELHVDTQAWAFGSKTTLAKGLQRDEGQMDLRAAAMRAFAEACASGGGTDDAAVLEMVCDSMKPGDREEIASEDCFDLCFFITDGGSNDSAAARKQLDRLLETGMIVQALQVGTVGEGEIEKFNAVWNDNRPEGNLGAQVPEVAELLPLVAELLYKYLSPIEL